MKVVENKFIRGTLTCRTGLHIGGSREELEIGGVDLPIIKHPVTGEPYVPGSSLKGKMRSGIEREEGKFSSNGAEPCNCAERDCMVCRIFGPHKKPKHELGPTRILVRDCMLEKASRDRFYKDLTDRGVSLIERKTENIINRKTGTAEHPRTLERVAAGTKFDVEVVLQLLDIDDQHKEKMLETVKKALRIVSDTYLGGGGSRGSGKVEFDLKIDGEPFEV